ncbi:transposase [Streptomyces sp. NPDC023327]|uniref:transposase n=1 Tax=Streptomyces sp. NPDC023327 TaxID=3157088 RepID=UPI0033F6907E
MDDDLWALIEPLLPPWPEKPQGPRPVPDRLCLQGHPVRPLQRLAWQLLPLKPGFGSGQTCWRRPDRWQQAGDFGQLHRILLAELNDLICEGRGTPLKVITTAVYVNDVTRTLAPVDGIPPVAGRPGRPRRRPDSLLSVARATPSLVGPASSAGDASRRPTHDRVTSS